MTLLTIVLALALAGLGVRIYMGGEAQDRLEAGEEVNLAELRSPLRKPSFLACPPQYCAAEEATASPVFDVPWERLRQFWVEMVSAQSRLVRVASNEANRQVAYIEHSVLFRFPDIVTVEFVPLGPSRSSIAIFSRSRYGEYDFAKNRKRVERWLMLLQRVVRPLPQG
jgi:uncharacterized protein DUF1499